MGSTRASLSGNITEATRTQSRPHRRRTALVTRNLSGTWTDSKSKRLFDLAVAVPALLFAMPVLLAVVIAIRLTSDGPFLFCQQRVGKGQKLFTIYKFRTMTHEEHGNGPSVTRQGDRRMTRLGGMLRKLKLDELPQLYNVVRGDMSLVGPRPKLRNHEQMRMLCRPGITGAATLIFAREEELLARIPEDQLEDYAVRVLSPIKARLDAEYALNSTFFTDMKILVDTALRLGGDSMFDLPEISDHHSQMEMGTEGL